MMLDIIKAIILGIVEGITEFLPISSTGHLILVNEFIKMSQTTQFTDMFNVVIQLGAIMAVVVLYFHKLNPLSPKKTHVEQHQTWVLWFKVIVAVLLIYGVLFILIENRNANRQPLFSDLNTLSYRTAFIIGMFQLLSLVPGTSRSGATILGGILIGTSRYVAAEFSFFLAIPTMFGASLLKVYKYFSHGGAFTGMQTAVLLTGMLVSFVVAYFAIRFLLNYIQHNNFKIFGWYRIILSLIVIGYFGFLAR